MSSSRRMVIFISGTVCFAAFAASFGAYGYRTVTEVSLVCVAGWWVLWAIALTIEELVEGWRRNK